MCAPSFLRFSVFVAVGALPTLTAVYVLDDHRGRGIGKWLLDVLLTHPDLQGLRRLLLATKDAHCLYRQYGFEPVADPSPFMEIMIPYVYRR